MMSRISILAAVLAVLPISAHAYFGPTVYGDELSSSVQGGTGFFLQTVSCVDHFVVGKRKKPGYLLDDNENPGQAKRPVGEEQVKAQELQHELLNLSWMLGYAYYRSSAHDPATGNLIYDEAHAVKLGLAWQAAGLFDLSVAAAYQVLPAENYSQGIFDLGALFTIPLVAEHEVRVAGSSEDAAVYYENQELAKQQVHVDAVKRFPNIQLGIQAEIQVHTKSPTSNGRSAGSTLTSDQTLNTSATGPELVLHVSPRLKFKLAAMVYLYGQEPADFLANTTIGGVRSKADLAVADFEGTTAYLLLFPKRTFSGSGTIWLNRAVNFNLILEGATYDATGSEGAGLLNSTFSTGMVLDWAFAPRWKTGFLADYTTGNGGYAEGAGGIKLGFAL